MASGLQEVGQAIIKLVYDDKDLEKQGDKVALKMSAKLKTAGVAAGAASVAGITKAIQAVGSLAQKSAEAYGEFEQLSGGIQKIFDEMDYSVIEKDALNAWEDLNLSAREYMKNISGVGATFAQTMGDKKGYETARKGMKSIADYASATGRNVDELMQKYQLISRTAGSYLSIADQFAGILPQTRDEFLKQAQAAGFLSEEYKSLTEVPVAEYQEALTNMLEKGVDNMGLLGNTAEETANTMTGSIAGAKAAIDNLITGFADTNADIPALTKTMVKAVGNALKNFGAIFEAALDGILEFIDEMGPETFDRIAEMLVRIIPKLIDTGIELFNRLVAYAPRLLGYAIQLLQRVITGLVQQIPQILATVVASIMSIVEMLTQPENLTLIIQGGIQLLMGLVNAIPEIITALAQALPQIIDNIVTFLTSPEAFTQITIATLTLLKAMVMAVPQIITALGEAFAKLFKNLWEKLKKNFSDFAAKFGDGIMKAFATGVNGVIGFIENAINTPIKLINGAIDAINKIPGVDIGKMKTISLPRVAMAEGGITTGPTSAIIGEAGREAVIPLEQNTGNWAGLLAGKLAEAFEEQGETTGTINVYFNNQINSKLDIDQVNRELLTTLRRAA